MGNRRANRSKGIVRLEFTMGMVSVCVCVCVYFYGCLWMSIVARAENNKQHELETVAVKLKVFVTADKFIFYGISDIGSHRHIHELNEHLFLAIILANEYQRYTKWISK